MKEEELLGAIHERVRELMDQDIGLLFSYLYRLDVSESDVKKTMDPNSQVSASLQLAKLIFDRQMQRVRTKRTIVQPPIEGWEW